MRDLPLIGDASAGEPRQPGPRQTPAGPPFGADEHPAYSAEIAHESTDVHRPRADNWPLSGRPPNASRSRTRRRRPRRTARWLVVYTALVLAVAGAGGAAFLKETGGGTSDVTLAGSRTNPSPTVGASTGPSVRASTSPSAAPSMNMGVEVGTGESGPDTLAGVLTAANNSAEGRGLIPSAKCNDYQQNASGQIVCMSPVPGVTEVYYQNYSSLPALYNAYETEVAELDGGTFRQNTGHCGNGAVSYAEFGWNQEEGHPHNFTVAQMAADQVSQIFAAGRMACFATRTADGVSQDLVWTIDNGPALGVAIGSGSPTAVYQLWASLHHTVLFRGTEMCGTAGRMNMHDIPTGNLKVVPVCPAGVEAVPASPSA